MEFFFCFVFHLFTGLTECDYYKTDEYNYTHFADIGASQSVDNGIRVSVYLIGPRDAHIILSSTNKPNRDKDFVYEFCKYAKGYISIDFAKLLRKF